MKLVDRAVGALERGLTDARKRWGVVDHAWRALDRFNDVLGGRLAAAISYYGFFAAFSLAVVVYSILGRLLNTTNGAIIGTIDNYLSQSMPLVRTTAKTVGTGGVTMLGLVGLALTGVAWVDALRSSTRAIWHLDQHPGNWFIRRVLDLVMLLVLGLLLVLSVATASAIDFLLDRAAGPRTGAFGDAVLRASGPVLEFLVNLVLAAAVLMVVPRLRLSPRRLIPAALLVGVGIQLLNSVGRLYIGRTEARPAYQLVVGAVGLLIYLFLLNQLILYGSAVAATASRGTAVDMAVRRSPHPVPEAEDEPVGNVAESAGNVGEPRPGRGTEPR